VIRIFLYLVCFTALFAFVHSCSSEDEQTNTPTAIVKTPEAEPDPIKYNLTVNASEGATVSTDGGTYDEGAEVIINANPIDGYVLFGWDVNGSSTEGCQNPINIITNDNLTVTANFILKDEFPIKDGDYLRINNVTYIDYQNGYGEWFTQQEIASVKDLHLFVKELF